MRYSNFYFCATGGTSVAVSAASEPQGYVLNICTFVMQPSGWPARLGAGS